MAADITAIILTKNEEVNITDCIKSIMTIVKRIVVVDSYSTDKTVELANIQSKKWRLSTMRY
ncbi:glycosyltransferase [Blautia luti]|uniref:glycosyltransferase n=1 Tax=Blautia luti TaxID=89014 RepID=UPI001D01276A|nr:glycosyltransferase [Blautia luti]MCB5474997.1 glycosyltransferase [Blautia luti]